MKLIVGLGNPEKQYNKSKHNLGYDCADLIIKNHTCHKNNHITNIYSFGDVKVIKPDQGMNVSGNLVYSIANFFKIETQDVVVIYDDMDLNIGKLKISRVNSSKHNGVRSILNQIGQGFTGVRLGIDRPKNKDEVLNYVLSGFNTADRIIIDQVILKAVEAVNIIIESGIDKAMSQYNGANNERDL